MSLAATGWERTRWVAEHMPLLREIASEFVTTRPFAGRTIGVSLHLEPKTAALIGALRAGGARVVAAGNHGSTQDDVPRSMRSRPSRRPWTGSGSAAWWT